MSEINETGIHHYAATIADLTGVDRPKLAEEPISRVVTEIRSLTGKPFDRLLIFSPDCYAQWMLEKRPEVLKTIRKHCPVMVPMHSMRPSVTPVCYSAIFTGAMPEVNGITEKKGKQENDSLFDSFIRAGKKVALITGEKNSMNVLWTGKGMSYFLYKSDEERIRIARELICDDQYDVIVCYLCGYDSADHKYGPEAPEAEAVFYEEAAAFDDLASLIKENWKGHITLVSFMTDHGCHACEPIAENDFDLGTHGSDMPCDQNILHFYGVID